MSPVHRRVMLTTAALVVLTARALAQADAALPPGRAGDAVRAYVSAINAADSSKILAWLKRYDPDGDLTVRTGRQLALARRTGGFVVERIIRGTSDAVEAVVRERKTNARTRLVLVLDPSGVAEGFGLEPIAGDSVTGGRPAIAGNGRAGGNAPARPMPHAELVRRIAAYVDSLAAAGQFSGVVSLSRRGAPDFEKAYGSANRAANVPNTLETAFNLGSIDKVFTATAVRQLAAAGRLHLDSSLARAWPSYPNREVARQVTIRQLLDHRSGIMADIFEVPGAKQPREIKHNNDFLRAVVNTPLRFPPGSREQYSNAGYVVLGGVVAAVSGEDYYDYVQKHIFAPAGMSRTGHYLNQALPPGTALGYTRGGDNARADSPQRPNTDMLPGRGSAAGGGYSTVADLKKFLSALRAGIIAGGPPPGIGVAGGAEGMNAVVDGELPGGYDLIVLANCDPPAAERISRQVHVWLGAN